MLTHEARNMTAAVGRNTTAEDAQDTRPAGRPRTATASPHPPINTLIAFTSLWMCRPSLTASDDETAAWFMAKGHLHEQIAAQGGPDAPDELSHAAAAYAHARKLLHHDRTHAALGLIPIAAARHPYHPHTHTSTGLLDTFMHSVVSSLGWHAGTSIAHMLGGWLIVLTVVLGITYLATRRRTRRRARR